MISSLTVYGQIDYHTYPQTIDSKHPMVMIDWLMSSPKSCPLDFNHLVSFINAKNDQTYNSKINVNLYQNDKLIRNFVFPVGDNIVNRIYTAEPLNLKKGDHVYFTFTLSPSTDEEQYVFNIYDEPRAVIKTIVTKAIPKKTETLHTKHKSYSDRHFRKMQRQPIGQEI